MSGLSNEDVLLRNVYDLRKRLHKTENSLYSLGTIETRLEDLPSNNDGSQTDAQTDASLSSSRTNGSFAYEFRSQPVFSTPKDKNLLRAVTSVTSSIVSEDENATLSGKMHSLRDENSQLVTQNHKLLSELENAGYELHRANAKITAFVNKDDTHVAKLEETVKCLQEAVEVGEKSLRDTEDRHEKAIYKVDKIQKDLLKSQKSLQLVHLELQEEKRLKHQSECRLEEALLSVNKIQEEYHEYQRQSQLKLKMQQEHLSQSEQEKKELEKKLKYQNLEEFRSQTSSSKEYIKDLRQKIARETQVKDAVHRENAELKGKVQHLQDQLTSFTQEIGQSKQKLCYLEELAQQLKNKKQKGRGESVDSGLSTSVKKSEDGLDSMEDGAASLLDKATIADLRLKLALKDADIQKLHMDLKQKAQSSFEERPPSQMDSLRNELMSVVETSKLGNRKNKELQDIITDLNEDRSKMEERQAVLKGKLADKETECTGLGTALDQANAKLTDLQKDLYDLNNEVEQLQRENRKKTSQITSLERQLDEKITEFTGHYGKNTMLEEEISKKNTVIDQLKDEIEEKMGEVMLCSSNMNKLKEMQTEQCQDYEKQIEIFQSRSVEKDGFLKKIEQELESAKNEVDSHVNKLRQTEKQLRESKQGLHNYKQQYEQNVQSLKHQGQQQHSQIKHLENALTMHKEELKLYIDQLSESKENYHGNLSEAKENYNRKHKEQTEEINLLRKQLNQAQKDNQVKESEIGGLEETLNERQSMLEQSTFRISELESTQGEMERKVDQVQQDLYHQQTESLQESQTMENKLHQACLELERHTNEVQSLTDIIKNLQSSAKQLSNEVNDVEKQLQLMEKENEKKEDKIVQLESELRDAKAKLKQYSITNDKLEDHLRLTQDNLLEQTKCTGDLDRELQKVQDNFQNTTHQLSDLQMVLQKSKSQIESREHEVEELCQTLRESKSEIEIKKREIEELESAVKQRQLELESRSSLVSELDLTIKEHKNDTQQRLLHLEASLKKGQYEIEQKTQQIKNMDEKCSHLQETLRDKDMQVQQVQQELRRQTTDIEDKLEKIKKLEKSAQALKEQFDELKELNQEKTQEIRLTREQFQKQHLDLTNTKKELVYCQHEQDRLAQEVDDTVNIVHNKETYSARLAEELGMSHAREVQVEAQMHSEIRRLKNELELQESHQQQQLSELQDGHAKTLLHQEEETAQYRLKVKDFHESEQELKHRISKLETEIVRLKEDLKTKNKDVDAAHEGVFIKEAEIARLHAKISGYERAVFGIRNTDNVSSPHLHKRSSTAGTLLDLEMNPMYSMKRSSSDWNISKHSDINNSNVSANPYGAVDDYYLDYDILQKIQSPTRLYKIERKNIKDRHNMDMFGVLLPSKLPKPSTMRNVRDISTESGTETAPNSFQGMLRQVNKDLKTTDKTEPTSNIVTSPLFDHNDLGTETPTKTVGFLKLNNGQQFGTSKASGNADITGGEHIRTLMQDYGTSHLDSTVPQLEQQKVRLASSEHTCMVADQYMAGLQETLLANKARRQQVQEQIQNTEWE